MATGVPMAWIRASRSVGDQRLVGHVQTQHDDGRAGLEHDPGGVRVDMDVELGGGGHVAQLHRAAHQHDLLAAAERSPAP